MLRVAMLSFAHDHTRHYAQAIVDHPEAELVKIWEDNDARGKMATEAFGIAYETDLEKVVSSDDVDAVVVDAPTKQHPWVIKTAMLQPEGIEGFIKPYRLPQPLPSPMEQWLNAILHSTEMTITV